MANYKYVIDFASNSAQFSKQLGDINSNIEAINKTAGIAAKTIGGLFAASAIKDAGVEMVDLAGRTQGVQEAFDKLNRPGLLDELKEATSGTVDELTLMRNAVKADKFKIPLDQLATYFKFATNTAAETGESVDYLVDSIITGLGRQSPLILDNLGISAKDLSDRFKETGDFGRAAGEIINETMQKSGEVTLTAAQMVMQWKAKIMDAKAEIGDRLLPVVGAMDKSITWVTEHSKELLAIIGGLTAAFVAYKTITMSAATAQMLITAAGNIKAFFELARGIKSAAEAQVLLSMVTKASPIGIIAGVVAAAAAAFMIFKGRANEAKDTQKELNVELKETNSLLDEFTRIVSAGTALEAMSAEQLAKHKSDIAEQLKVEDDFRVKLVENEKKRLAEDAQLKDMYKALEASKLDEFQKMVIQNNIKGIEAGIRAEFAKEEQLRKKRVSSLNSQLKDANQLLEPRKTEMGLIEAINFKISETEKLKNTTTDVKLLAIYNDQLATLREQVEALDQLSNAKGGGFVAATTITEDPTDLMPDESGIVVQDTPPTLTPDYWKVLGNEIKNTTTLANIFSGVVWEMSDAFENLFAGTEAGFKDMVTAMMGGLQTIINGLLAQAIAGMIAGESSKGLIGLLTASVGIAALVGLWKSKVPAFADGGIVYGPTMGLMGEYPGASSNPEVIAPLSKLQSMIGGGGMGGEVQFRIEGTTLVGVLANQRSKTKGITGR